ncbi:hypothetical protein F5877DRAFT_72265 [Lentinula edodes]|nr:hypothetical protein F5877DRAFT_72265 [Lentinula edodes]
MDSDEPPYWPYEPPGQSERDSSEPDYEGMEESSDEELPVKRGPSPSWLDGWDDFHSNSIHSSSGVTVALRLLREISGMSWKEWEATMGAPEEGSPSSYVTTEEMERLLERGELLEEIRRQVINCLSERDTALRHANAARYELSKLRQDVIGVGEALLQAARETNHPNFPKDLQKVAMELIQHGIKGSKGREDFELKARRLKPYPLQSLHSKKDYGICMGNWVSGMK